MFWRIFRHVFMDEANAGEGGGASAGSADAGATGGAEAVGNQDGAGSAADAGGAVGSVLAAAAGTQPAGAPQIPEKYQVKKEDGTLDVEASSLKLAEAYGHLEKRLGSGDVPPKTAEEYQVTVPDALKDHWKPETDPLFAEFKKDAHAAGLSQKQFDLVMGKYMALAPQLIEGSQQLSEEACTADLKHEWKTDQQYKEGVSKAYKALTTYAGQEAEAIMRDHGNDPRLIRLLSRVGAELGEDSSINPGGTLPGGQTVEALMTSEAYTNPKHPEHVRVSQQVQAYFNKQSEAAAKAGNVPIF